MTFLKNLRLGTLLAISESSFLQKATFFEARFRDGYPEPRFTFWRPGRGGRMGGKPPAAKGRCPLESLLQKTHRTDPGHAQSGAPHSGQRFVPPSVRNTMQARSTVASSAPRPFIFAAART